MQVLDQKPFADGSQDIELRVYRSEASEVIEWGKTLDYSTGEVPECIEDLISSLAVGLAYAK